MSRVDLGLPARGRNSAEETRGAGLAAELRAVVRGEVRFDAGDRALYATDASNYRQLPIGVVIPRDLDDVVAALAVCREHQAPVFGRGAGTSLAGQCCNAGVCFDFSKYCTSIVNLDPAERTAVVEPGVVLDDLRAAAERHSLTFGPDPATHSHCTLGGMIGNNSCGVHSVMAGRTSDNVQALEILTYDGERFWVGPTPEEELSHIIAGGGERGRIYAALRDLRDRYSEQVRARYPAIPRRVSGYNLDELLPERGFDVARALVGTESTCVLVLQARLRLVPSPAARSLVVLGYPDGPAAADAVPAVLEHSPVGLEGFDGVLVEDVKAMALHPRGVAALPAGGGWLLVEFGADTTTQARRQAQTLIAAVGEQANAKLIEDPAELREVWGVRESGLGAAARVPGQADTWAGWEDAAVDPARLGGYLREFRELLDSYGYHAALYGHFGQGCVHTRIDFDLVTAAGVVAFRRFVHEAARLVAGYGGSISGEHGDGQARAELLPIMFGEELTTAFAEFKAVWDPAGRMNPGKVVDPYPLDGNLRLGPTYRPRQVETFFSYPGDDGDFSRAVGRCVGVGDCRRHEGATMCPSYRVTREEADSTRGRSRLLFEMLNGAELAGWRDESVKAALDLCLACKGCKSDCPVNVDMATYKAEFLAHYYAGRLRPPSAYAIGLIMYWARLASHAPRLVNALAHSPGLSRLAKRAAGIAVQRDVPRFATQTFRDWYAQRGPVHTGGERLILWPDTFTNYLRPGPAIAAVEVLEAAGFQVDLPRRGLCCGRPLYDFGFLTHAKKLLANILDALAADIDAGIPLIGLEPSCVAVFRDELPNLFPNDPRAQRLARQTLTLAEFLRQRDVAVPRLSGKAIVQKHCHHNAVIGFEDERAVLAATGMEVEVLDSGCCGMAGAFGFEAAHYQLSQDCGELVLLPAVRAADPLTRVLADGFSCHEQIRQATGRRALHLAEILRPDANHRRGGPG